MIKSLFSLEGMGKREKRFSDVSAKTLFERGANNFLFFISVITKVFLSRWSNKLKIFLKQNKQELLGFAIIIFIFWVFLSTTFNES